MKTGTEQIVKQYIVQLRKKRLLASVKFNAQEKRGQQSHE